MVALRLTDTIEFVFLDCLHDELHPLFFSALGVKSKDRAISCVCLVCPATEAALSAVTFWQVRVWAPIHTMNDAAVALQQALAVVTEPLPRRVDPPWVVNLDRVELELRRRDRA